MNLLLSREQLLFKVAALESANAMMREQVAAYRRELADLDDAVVDLADGRALTLRDVIDDGAYRRIDWCGKAACEGCPFPTQEALAEYQMESHDRE